MKKLLLTTAFLGASLFAEVTTILPYGGEIDYGADAQKTYKDKATLLGIHATYGDLSYLIEADYAHLQTKYISEINHEDLKQNDFTLVYGKYYTNFMFRLGAHYVSTNDVELGDGYVGIATLGGYNYFGYDKLSYGTHLYYINYSDGHNENYEKKSISILQATPYISYYKSLYYKAMKFYGSNTVTLKGYFQNTDDFITKNYSTFEISDALLINKTLISAKYYNGKMRAGVKDSGMTVFNTLDEMKYGYELKVGYYFTPSAFLSASYAQNTYREFDEVLTSPNITKDNTNQVMLASFSYSF